MRRMLTEREIIRLARIRPSLITDGDINNDNAFHLNMMLPIGLYLIELHQKYGTNTAILKVSEEDKSISTVTLFNPSEVATAYGYYQFDQPTRTLEIYTENEDPVFVKGHIDIFRIM